jgi:hypothetical protein
LFADEAFWAGDKPGESTLKALITEPVLMIEPKNINPFQWKNLLHIGMAANAKWVIPATHDERRFVVSDCSKKLQDKAYFKALVDQMNNGGLEAMFHDLLLMDLGDWHPREIIQTEALRLQKEHSMPYDDQWLEALLQDGELPGRTDRPDRATTKALLRDIKERMPRISYVTEKALSMFLREHGCIPWRTAGERGWEFPPLPEARSLWERRYGSWLWRESLTEWRHYERIGGLF